MEIDAINRNEIEKLMSRATGGQELEVRFGKFVYNKCTRKSNFVSEVEIPFFYNLKRALDKQNFTKITKKTTDYIYNQTQLEGTIKRTMNEDGTEEYMLKNGRRMYRDVYDYDFRVSLASEKKLQIFPREVDPSAHNLVREKVRTSYNIPIGRIDMTIVKENGTTGRTKYEVEMEIHNDGSVTYDNLMMFVQIILQIKQNNHYVISGKERKVVVDEYKGIFGLKGVFFVGAQPETLQKNGIANLYKEKYSVTDKADGDRVFMMLTKDKKVYFIDNNINTVYKTDLTSSMYHSTVIDGELVHIDNKVYFLAFDVVAYNGKDLRGDSHYLLATRLNRLNHIIGTIASNEKYSVQMKKFYYNNVFLGSEVLLDTVDKKPYKNDGLIFTPMDEPYPTVKKWSKLLKWKPAELNTIDFYSKRVNGTNTWELYVQHTTNQPAPTQHDSQCDSTQTVDRTKATSTQITLFDVSRLCNTPQPVQEMTYQTTFDDTFIDPSTNEPFQTDTVIEYMWDKSQSKFVPLRTRWDKTTNPSKHGNFSAVACSIWNNIHNPVEKELLFKFTTHTGSAKEDFFFERMRRFHNKVKEYVYNKYTKDCEYLLELCSGKGGDLHKWLHNNVKNVTGYDISQKAVSECRRRVQTTTQPIGWKPNYLFYEADLCQDDAYLKIVQDHKDPYDVVCCQFGVHYFFQSQNTFDSLLRILENSLREGGYFVVTFMDQKQTLELLGGSDVCIQESDNEIAYYIKRYNGSTNGVFGNQLRIVMSGNNVLKEGSNEFLIDYNLFCDRMQKAGFVKTEDVLFKDVYNEFVHQYKLEPLSKIEKEISFLNRLCVFHKTKDGAKDVPFNVSLNVPMRTPQKTTDTKTLFNFETIQLQQNGVTVFKVCSKYEVVDVVNCIEHKYYKNCFSDSPITCFDDIVATFEELGMHYTAAYIQDPLDYSDCKKATKSTTIYFTYHKHVVEKKNADGEMETSEYDNWYVVMYKNKLLGFPPNQPKLDTVTVNNTPPQPIESPTRKQQILQELEGNPKVTLKILKEYLCELGLKVTGKKDELYNRLVECCKTN